MKSPRLLLLLSALLPIVTTPEGSFARRRKSKRKKMSRAEKSRRHKQKAEAQKTEARRQKSSDKQYTAALAAIRQKMKTAGHFERMELGMQMKRLMKSYNKERIRGHGGKFTDRGGPEGILAFQHDRGITLGQSQRIRTGFEHGLPDWCKEENAAYWISMHPPTDHNPMHYVWAEENLLYFFIPADDELQPIILTSPEGGVAMAEYAITDQPYGRELQKRLVILPLNDTELRELVIGSQDNRQAATARLNQVVNNLPPDVLARIRK